MSKRVFAFFVGIDVYEYTQGFDCLSGAEADVGCMVSFLEGLADEIDFQPEILLGSKASRDRIIDGIQQHLGQAKEGDIALFYFSGHGLREEVPDVFKSSSSLWALESLACFDSYAREGVYGLANKELRYLINAALPYKPELLVITDCCHSAMTTRSGNTIIRRTATPWTYHKMPARRWEHFLFAPAIPPEGLSSPGEIEEKFSQATHLHMAACQASESAFEVGGKGVFTAHLLEVLQQSSGAVTYRELHDRVSSLMRSRSRRYAQTPSIYEPRPYLADKIFLDLNRRKSKIYLPVSVGEVGVILNRGLIHGIPFEKDQIGIEISILEKNKHRTGELTKASIKKTHLNYSELQLSENIVLQEDCIYEGLINGLFQRDFNVALYGSGSDEDGKQLIRTEYKKVFKKEIAEEPGPETDCVVVLHDNQFILAHPDSDYPSLNEKSYLPLARQITGYLPDRATEVVQNLQHIAQYMVVRQISNPRKPIKGESINFQINVETESAPSSVAQWNQAERCFDIYLTEDYKGVQKGFLSFQFFNNTQTELYICLAYLSHLYGVDPTYLDSEGNALPVDAGKVWISSEEIKFSIENFIVEYNQPYENGLFRLFVANEAFSLKSLQMNDLIPPKLQTRGINRAKNDVATPKGIRIEQPEEMNWTVLDFPVRLINALYKDEK